MFSRTSSMQAGPPVLCCPAQSCQYFPISNWNREISQGPAGLAHVSSFTIIVHLCHCFKGLTPTCHGFSQSSGIGKAPSQLPTRLEIVVIWRLFSQIEVTPFLLKTLNHALIFGPNKHKQGTVVKVDKVTANKKVSNTNSTSGAPYRTKIIWKMQQDRRK